MSLLMWLEKIERTLEIARALKAQNIAVAVIMATTGLTQGEIEGLMLNWLEIENEWNTTR